MPIGEDALFAELAKIEGFDTAAGVFYAGNNAAYIDILRQFCDEFDGYMDEIHRYLTGEDWKNFSIKLHAMKGVFAAIGMDSLSKWALKLELASRGGDWGTCKKEIGAFGKAITGFKEALVNTRLMEKEEAGPKTQVEAGLLAEKLKSLQDACSRGDSDTADTLAAELAGMSLNADTDAALTKICGLAQNLDYGPIAEKIDALIAALAAKQ